jgi:hypothetical protein
VEYLEGLKAGILNYKYTANETSATGKRRTKPTPKAAANIKSMAKAATSGKETRKVSETTKPTTKVTTKPTTKVTTKLVTKSREAVEATTEGQEQAAMQKVARGFIGKKLIKDCNAKGHHTLHRGTRRPRCLRYKHTRGG